MDDLPQTPRTTLHRRANRGSYDRALIHAILDEALVCHVGFVAEGQPFVIPTAHARVGDRLYVHGSASNRMLGALRSGSAACATVTLLDGLVLARSAFHHSLNYRSVVILGVATEATDHAEKRAAVDALVEHIAPGRLLDVRAPSDGEIDATRVLWLPIAEASAKVRTGPPLDTEEDYALPYWAGELPLALTAGAPVPDPRLPPGVQTPPALFGYRRAR